MSDGAQTRRVDVAIVGAGFAGLAACQELTESGLEAVVLEARDRVGGRVLNHDIGDGKVVEVGGQWVGPTQHALLGLAAELGVETYPTYLEGDNLIEYLQGRESADQALADATKAYETSAKEAGFIN